MKNADSYPPGLLEQYKISLERLKNGVGCEFISFPGLNSRPSEFLLDLARLFRILTYVIPRPAGERKTVHLILRRDEPYLL